MRDQYCPFQTASEFSGIWIVLASHICGNLIKRDSGSRIIYERLRSWIRRGVDEKYWHLRRIQTVLRGAYLKVVDKFVDRLFWSTSEAMNTEVWFDCSTFLVLHMSMKLFECDVTMGIAWVDTRIGHVISSTITIWVPLRAQAQLDWLMLLKYWILRKLLSMGDSSLVEGDLNHFHLPRDTSLREKRRRCGSEGEVRWPLEFVIEWFIKTIYRKNRKSGA